MRFFNFLWLFLFGFFFVSAGLEAAEKKFTVVIDPGHGGKDAGAVGSVLKLHEKKINLAVALELGELLEAEKDVNVIYTRKTDVFIPLDERPRIANKAKADLFISIHTNAAKNKAASGTETYVIGSSSSAANMEVAMRENSVILYEEDYQTRYEGFDPNSSESYIMFDFMQFTFLDQSLHLAACIQDEFKTTCNREDRGVKQAGFLVLKQASMPSILVELGYISNQEEEKHLNKKASQKKLAEAIYNAFLVYKTNYEKKSGIAFDDSKNEEVKPDKETKQEDGKASEKNVPEIRYRVQFHTSSKRKPLNSKEFKNYAPVKEYLENGVYKYMYGETTSYAEILEKKKKIQEHFSDAFVVVFKNEKRLSPAEARAYFK
ncbi:MAG: N-acetylmuramoyl-L-alanine amidase [Prevotellaceae bacterium]|nr:N-acetylmuramoyl-L-alanine amidase [Prevotellaceae bacterium]